MSTPVYALAFSHTVLSQYENCPEAARQIYVLRAVRKTYTVESTGGIDAHKVLEARIKSKTPLPPQLSAAEPYVASLESRGHVEAEVSLGVDHLIRPASFWNGWLRGKFDVVQRWPEARRAVIVDWKTGKVREGSDQLELGALLLMENDPTIDKVTGFNIWLGIGQIGVPFVFERETKTPLWGKWIKKMRAIEARDSRVEWEKREGPLCAYCPVEKCEHWRPRR